jgi:hypothetical protein
MHEAVRFRQFVVFISIRFRTSFSFIAIRSSIFGEVAHLNFHRSDSNETLMIYDEYYHEAKARSLSKKHRSLRKDTNFYVMMRIARSGKSADLLDPMVKLPIKEYDLMNFFHLNQ